MRDITTEDGDRIYTVRIPTIFADDHASRDCLTGIAIKRNARGVVFSCNREEFTDWLTDAEYYATLGNDHGGDPDDWLPRSLVPSARRALKNCTAAKEATP